jgi:hypothetical protein
MTTPSDMLDALEELNLKEVVLEAIEDHKEDYVKLNLEQLYQGLNPQGEKITPEYVEGPYRRKKARMNSAPGEGTPDFKLSGDSYDETHAEVDEDEIEIKTDTEYFQYNEQRWGDAEIWGLDESNHEEFVDEILQPLIVEKVSELTGLK